MDIEAHQKQTWQSIMRRFQSFYALNLFHDLQYRRVSTYGAKNKMRLGVYHLLCCIPLEYEDWVSITGLEKQSLTCFG